ncbi:helix-turn-helix domain-containing protein [uncultured Desulfobacter sp.]|uniref:TrmB family transcriptional regulator n=1 Tax=uncultured Desulfobacter sp. TaxID=240139 RepID=UPI002AAA9768|nr:helix-turn-helix domain-containing protein [uncultured Desulfobacter sp.]
MDTASHITEHMKALGFSAYECKAYLALLEEYPLNGYALSKASGVPRSRIYEVLKSLIDKQMVFEQDDGKSKTYTPMDPEIFIKKLQSRFQGIFQDLTEYAGNLYRQPKQENRLMVIQGRDNILSFLAVLIKGAQQRIAVSIWDEELNALTNELDAALARGVMLRGIYFGSDNVYKDLVPHRRLQRYMAEKKERFLSAIVDHSHAVSGVVSRGVNSTATWTRDEGFIEVSEDYIAHDLIVNLYSASLDRAGYKKFETFADNVHDHFFHYSQKELNALKP